ncbi:unnamed protein product [Amoebophrya sp. A120]|nr:unnamed protein product [Amoebophrya sp. A120]|eukprot:GSA120T00018235001.1
MLDLRTQTQLRPELQAICHAVLHFRLPPVMRKMHGLPTPASTTVGIFYFCVEGFQHDNTTWCSKSRYTNLRSSMGRGDFHFDATYFKIPGGKFVPQITVLIEKAPGAENIEVKELMPRPPKEGSK